MGMFDNDEDEDQSQSSMNPVVRDYLLKKQGTDVGPPVDAASLSAQYDRAAKDTSEVDKARSSADSKNMWLGVTQGLSQMMAGRKHTNEGFFNDARAANEKKVADAGDKQKQRLSDLLTKDRLTQQDVERARSSAEFSRKEQGWNDSDALVARERDVNSEESKLARQLASKMLPNRDFSQSSAAQLKSLLPTLEKVFEIEAAKAKAAAPKPGQPYEYTDDQGNKRLGMYHQGMGLVRTPADQIITPFKPSVEQTKQAGLVEAGNLANKQYEDAVTKGKTSGDYDPTDSTEFIDNSTWLVPNWMKSDSAIEAQRAQSSWVESYLRDASGAAIPPSERMEYAKDFFPQPGDTEQVVLNKKKLREQKERTARFSAGNAARDSSEDPGKKPGVHGADLPD
jgi:hypothetical protein